MGRLSGHPNIVNVLQVGVTPSGRPYIVMPYHRADSLAQRLQRSGPLSWPETVRIGVKLCGALETAHKAGMLHRDIKPGNVLTTDYGEPQLTDFGIARIAGGIQDGDRVLQRHDRLTPRPRCSRGNTLRSWPTSTRSAPRSTRSSPARRARQPHRRTTDRAVPADHLVADARMRHVGMPGDVSAAIARSMSLHPGTRFTSAAEFGRELQAVQRRNGLHPDNMALPSPGGQDSEGIPTTGLNLRGTGSTRANSRFSSPPSTARPTPPPSIYVSPPASADPTSTFSSQQTSHPSAPATGGAPRISLPKQQAAAPDASPATQMASAAPPPSPPQQQSVPSDASPATQMAAAVPPRASLLNQPPAPATPAPNTQEERQKALLIRIGAGVAMLLVIGLVLFLVFGGEDKDNTANPGPANGNPAETQANWQPITNARVGASGGGGHGDPTARSGSSAGSTATARSVDATRATTPRSTAGRAATTYRFRCSMRWR